MQSYNVHFSGGGQGLYHKYEYLGRSDDGVNMLQAA